MKQTSPKELLQAFVPTADLRRVVIPGVDSSQWIRLAKRMNVHAAIQHLLEVLPRQAPIEVLEMIDGAQADRIRQIHAARAVLTAFIASTLDGPA